MKRVVLVLVLMITATVAMTSCTASKGSRGGCKMTQGMVGYR